MFQVAPLPVALDGTTLTPEAVEEVARGETRVELTEDAKARNLRAHHTNLAFAEGGGRVYGLNTGVGSLRSVEIPAALTDEYQKRLLRSHAIGAGEPVAGEVGRAALVVRANQLAAGGAGVHPELLEAITGALNEGLAPAFRELGSLGTADLTSMAEAGLALIGEKPFADGTVRPAAPLGPRDGLTLMSSSAHSLGEAALCLVDLRRLARNLEACAALSFEAARANEDALDERVHAARPHPGQVASAARLRELLDGYASEKVRIQDSYAFRCIPQIGGVLRDALDHLGRVLEVDLNAASENALLVDGDALTTGNFHAAPLAVALDHVRNAVAQAASLAAARVSALMDPGLTGLTPFLAGDPGPDSGLMTLEYTVNSAVGELRMLAAPAAAQNAVFISHGVENHASFAALAARQTTRCVRLLANVAATELLTAVRAARMAENAPRGFGSRQAFEVASRHLSPETTDRPLTGDLDAATELVMREELP